jgi:hypothetical protein
MPPEARLVKRIQHHLEQKGARPFKIMGQDEGYQEIGIPDLLVCFRGYFVGLEVKQPGEAKDVSPRQEYVLQSIKKAGGVAGVVTSIGDVDRLLAKIERREVK